LLSACHCAASARHKKNFHVGDAVGATSANMNIAQLLSLTVSDPHTLDELIQVLREY